MDKRKREESEYPSLEQINEIRQAHRRHLSQSTRQVTLDKHQAGAVQQVMDAFKIDMPAIKPSKSRKSTKARTKYALSDTEDEDENKPLFGTVQRRVCISSPTGSGKTLMMMAIIDKLWAAGNHAKVKSAHRGQVLIIVPSLEIAKQVKIAAEKYLVKQFGNNISIGVEQGQTRAHGKEDLIIAMWQSLHMCPKRLSSLDPGTFELVITDECHHAPCHCISRMLRYFNSDVPILTHKSKSKFMYVNTLHHAAAPSEKDCDGCKRFNFINTGEEFKVKLLGMSATPDRSDKLETKMIFPFRIEAATFKELMDNGRYVGFEGHWTREKEARRAQAGTKKLARSSAQRHYGDLTAAIVRNVVLAQKKGRKHILVFCESLALVYAMRDAFLAADVAAETMQGQTTARKRQEIVQEFESGDLPVMINCGVLVEGADLPKVDCLVIAQPTKSQIRMTQMLGRRARLSPGKKDCLVLDFTVDHKENKGLRVFPDLMGVMKPVKGWAGYQGDEPSSGSESRR